MTEIKNETGVGQVQIADEVIAAIAGTAALEIDGVAGMAGNITGDIAEILGRKNLSKGVKVEVAEGSVAISVNLLVKFGYKIQDVSRGVQARVKTAVETMTGLSASEVTVVVSGVLVEKDKVKDGPEQSMDNEL